MISLIVSRFFLSEPEHASVMLMYYEITTISAFRFYHELLSKFCYRNSLYIITSKTLLISIRRLNSCHGLVTPGDSSAGSVCPVVRKVRRLKSSRCRLPVTVLKSRGVDNGQGVPGDGESEEPEAIASPKRKRTSGDLMHAATSRYYGKPNAVMYGKMPTDKMPEGYVHGRTSKRGSIPGCMG